MSKYKKRIECPATVQATLWTRTSAVIGDRSGPLRNLDDCRRET
ncbi:hypothetical protein [Symmachiella dynata]|nr:hypothetical protein [Symmachiella dynata]